MGLCACDQMKLQPEVSSKLRRSVNMLSSFMDKKGMNRCTGNKKTAMVKITK